MGIRCVDIDQELDLADDRRYASMSERWSCIARLLRCKIPMIRLIIGQSLPETIRSTEES